MEKIVRRNRRRRARLTKLAQAMIRCASPDIYFAQNDGLQQIGLPVSESAGYACIAPEQIYAVARIKANIL
jgi:hypothetical protein